MDPNTMYPGANPGWYLYDWSGMPASTQPYRNKSSLRGLGASDIYVGPNGTVYQTTAGLLGIGPVPFLPIIGAVGGYVYAKKKKKSKLLFTLSGFAAAFVLNTKVL